MFGTFSRYFYHVHDVHDETSKGLVHKKLTCNCKLRNFKRVVSKNSLTRTDRPFTQRPELEKSRKRSLAHV